MRSVILLLTFSMSFGKGNAQATTGNQPPDKMNWWKDAKFGLFIHWEAARGERKAILEINLKKPTPISTMIVDEPWHGAGVIGMVAVWAGIN